MSKIQYAYRMSELSLNSRSFSPSGINDAPKVAILRITDDTSFINLSLDQLYELRRIITSCIINEKKNKERTK